METVDWANVSLNERVEYVCEMYFDGNVVAMSMAIGVPRSTIRSIINEKGRSPRVDVVQKIVAYAPLNINPAWLLTGEGEVTPSGKTESGADEWDETERAELKEEILTLHRKIERLRDELDKYKSEENYTPQRRAGAKSA